MEGFNCHPQLGRPRCARWRNRGERGFSLILLSLTLVVLLGMVGLGVDLGRMFIHKTELQTFADASALAAISQMDGTALGIQLADSMATTGPAGATSPNRYNFGTTTVTNVVTSYATSFTGTYDNYATASSNATNQYSFIRVSVSANVPLNFLPVISGIPTSMSVSASAIAGQKAMSSATNGGLLPFAPDAHNQADTTNFGFTPGVKYTLKWGNGNTTTCAGDAGFEPPGAPPSEHGFVDIGEGNSNSNVRSAIMYGGYPNASSTPSSLSVGMNLYGVPGNRGSSIFSALSDRAGQDTDDYSTSYATYRSTGAGNGRRIVTVVIAGTWSGNGSNAKTPVLGFANFFLDASYSGSSGPICATYIGPADLNGVGAAKTDASKIYTNVLFQ